VANWPAVQCASDSTQAVCNYLREFAPSHPVQAFFGDPEIQGRFFYSDDFRGFNFKRSELSLGDLLERLLQLVDVADPPSIYAGAVPLKGELAAVCAENRNFLLDDSIEQLRSVWIGNRCRTATHWDLAQNIACVVAGHRRFTLFPPEQLANLYMGPLDFTLAGQPVSLVDLLNPDFERFPRFELALASAQCADLEPGDALYIPSMWFHNVESLDPLGILINFWWRESAPYMFTPSLTLMHALLSIRDMPKDERDAWRRIFDYYIFQSEDDPLAHVPEHARGFFGELSPERVARLRAYLKQTLGG
jgi:hypothetical protein